ncbi:MAG: hypothetical protein GY946_07405 [bacterium]|nr:hypothetical protein [bacterium]
MSHFVASPSRVPPAGQPPRVQLSVEPGDGASHATEIPSQSAIRMQPAETLCGIREALLDLIEVARQPPEPASTLCRVPERPGFAPQLPQLAQGTALRAPRMPGIVASMAEQATGEPLEFDR